MAEVSVSTWDALRTAVSNAGSSDIVKLTADIDMNDEYRTGVDDTKRIIGSCTIDGDGHTIRNIRYIGGIYLFSTPSSNSWLTVKDIKLENMIIESGRAFRRVQIYDSDVTLELENGTELADSSNIAFTRCGVDCKGYGDAKFIAEVHWLDDNNINLTGQFYTVKLAPRRTFISGDFSVDNSQYLVIQVAIKSVFTATFSGRIWGTTSSTYTKGCAIDRTVAPGEISYEGVFLQCTTEQIKSPSYLTSQGFPIIPLVVGGG